ncbi:MAG: hypothetical protein NZL95_03505 [Chitinophagales bacterium]|nr:hypothetical protein [Chitinophagales bacterium]MDW8427596.1 hypothetical protein [Chitinophagales bacterium]
MKRTTPVVQQAEAYVFALLRDRLPSHYVFHNYCYAASVVDAIGKLAEAEQLDKEVSEQLMLAGWFLPTGYTETSADRLATSARYAVAFLQQQMVPQSFADRVAFLITAAQKPADQPAAAVLADAQHFWLAKKDFLQRLKLLFWEEQEANGTSEHSWMQQKLEELSAQRYHTFSAAQWWEQKRLKNLLKLKDHLAQTASQELLQTSDTHQAAHNVRWDVLCSEAQHVRSTSIALLALAVLACISGMWLLWSSSWGTGLSVAAPVLLAGGFANMILSAAALWPLSHHLEGGPRQKAKVPSANGRAARDLTGNSVFHAFGMQLLWRQRLVRISVIILIFTVALSLLLVVLALPVDKQ